MNPFLQAHEAKIHGALGCFDRMVFRGYLPIQWGGGMAEFLLKQKIPFCKLKPFLVEKAKEVKAHAIRFAAQQGRPYQYRYILAGPRRDVTGPG